MKELLLITQQEAFKNVFTGHSRHKYFWQRQASYFLSSRAGGSLLVTEDPRIKVVPLLAVHERDASIRLISMQNHGMYFIQGGCAFLG